MVNRFLRPGDSNVPKDMTTSLPHVTDGGDENSLVLFFFLRKSIYVHNDAHGLKIFPFDEMVQS